MPVRFSVIMPLFNKRADIERTLSCLFAQDFSDFEAVIVDDGSTDGSLELVEAVADPRVRLFRQANAGPGPARNTAAQHATGEWLALLDADDLWAPDHLTTLDKIIRAHPEAGFISSRALWVSAHELDMQKLMPRGGAIWKPDYFRDSGERLCNTSSVAIRADQFKAVGGFGSFCPGEETELYSRLALATPLAVCEDPTAIYLRANGGIMEQLEREGGGGRKERPCDQRHATPLEKTLLGALADPRHAAHHAGITQYLDRLRLRDARICLYHGRRRAARRELAALSRPMLARSWAYRLLAVLPSFALDLIVALHSRWKHSSAIRPMQPSVG